MRARSAAGAPTVGGPTSRGGGAPHSAAEDGRALLESAREIHAERHGARTFTPGTRLPFPEAAERAGIGTNRQRYHDALEEMEYEGIIEWDESARYARGDRHYLITRRGLDGQAGARGETLREGQAKLF